MAFLHRVLSLVFLASFCLLPVAGCRRGVSSYGADLRIRIDSSLATPIAEGFSGFNTQPFSTGIEPWDPDLVSRAEALKPGFLRVPGGAIAGAYDWRSGNLRQEWVEAFRYENLSVFDSKNSLYRRLDRMVKRTRGKGGTTIRDFARLARKLACRLVYNVNIRTDTVESARALAKYTVQEGIQVDLWELGGETFAWTRPGKPTQFWQDGADYVASMEDFASAIRTEIPGAPISVAFSFGDSDPNQQEFDLMVAAHPVKFWTDIVFHWYPGRGTLDLENGMVRVSKSLEEQAEQLVDDYFLPLNAPLTPGVSITEWNSAGRGDYHKSLFSAVHAGEYLLRLSGKPAVKRLGFHMLLLTGLDMENPYGKEPWIAGKATPPRTLDTQDLDFGIFETPPALALRVFNPVLNGSREWLETRVENLRDPSAGSKGIFARTFRLRDGREVLLISNRSGKEERIEIFRDGMALHGPFTVTGAGGWDPGRENDGSSTDMTVDVRTGERIVKVPPYGFLSISWAREASLVIPQNLAGVSTPGGVGLSWNAVPGATGYRVLYGTSSDAWTREATVGSGVSFEVTGLEPGAKYAFSVTAIGAGGESAPAVAVEVKAGGSWKHGPTLNVTEGLVPGIGWRNPEVEVEFRWGPEWDSEVPLVLLARSDAQEESLALRVASEVNGSLAWLVLEKRSNGSVVPLSKSDGLTLQEGAWYGVRFEVDEGLLRGWLNDRLIVSAWIDPTAGEVDGFAGVILPAPNVEVRNFAIR